MGYPNVGKSSTINTIMGNKKVSVSATPGHTKHFQVFISTASASVFPSQPVPHSGHFQKFFVTRVLFFSLLLLYAQYRPLIVFQTLFVEPGLCLCDCPGLVMPSFVSTKAEMTCNGILPIDQMRDHVPPISLISFLLCKNSGGYVY